MVVLARVSLAGLLLVMLAGPFVPTSARVDYAQPVDEPDGVAALLQGIEQALLKGRPEGYFALVAPGADEEKALGFARPLFRPGITRATVAERDRQPLRGTIRGDGYRLLVEALLERGRAARILTWRFDVRRSREDETRWVIAEQEQVSSLDGLHQLQLDTTRQFAARDLTITSIDFSLTLPKGHVYLAETDAGVTGLVLVGNGRMRFAPGPAAERRQVRIFAGGETLDAPFEAALVRLNPSEYAERVSFGALTAEGPNRGSARAAQAFFDAQVGHSFAISTDLSPGISWSLTPAFGDFLSDVRTKKLGTLTFARSSSEAEDVTLFDRRRRRNIALYASPQKLEARGRYYNEDDLAEYDVLSYDIDTTFLPEREWVEGRATVSLKVRAPSLATLTLRLAESLNVRAIVSPTHGRLLFFRVVGQNSIVVSLPSMLTKDQQISLTVAYSGRLGPQLLDREAITVSPQQELASEFPSAQPEPRYIYSNRAYWYPQSSVTDYATATLRISLPSDLACVGSGELTDVRTVTVPADRGEERRRQFTFEARQPVRYLGCVISRFVGPEVSEVSLTTPSAQSAATTARSGPPTLAAAGVLRLGVSANPRQQSRGRSFRERAAAMIQFYSSLAGDTPYPSFTLAVTESDLPGGHSPAYFAVINQPAVLSNVSWRNDPVNFDSFPSFFLAHEVAHQWWGQAVGWKNYHEQWISEGFAQYFAALYARQERGDDLFVSVLRQMRRWANTYSEQGPISLGYRLGHIKGDSRVFRGVLYNKSAVVLDMLRRLIGDPAFFRGLRRFYLDSRFRKAGTDDVKAAFEAESGEELDRFFDGWIFSADLPTVRIQRQIVTGGSEGPMLKLLFTQEQPELFDLVIPIAVRYHSGPEELVEVRVRERRTEATVPLKGQLRSIEPDPEKITLARFNDAR
ncbi:MAG TPA: M1 family aminopeptidase [Vicinamibacterales bacterium]|nr:M1 family aminopeptidase [Vicinamibacterales bacterium]